MTKKENRRTTVRRTRRILNRNLDFNAPISGHKLHRIRYGDGLNRRAIVEEKEKNPD